MKVIVNISATDVFKSINQVQSVVIAQEEIEDTVLSGIFDTIDLLICH
ncbi:hypothetical protein [Candidatus Enterococcus willemsii]|nr:hypothetical protein [Enterococcus sp. CU12B]